MKIRSTSQAAISNVEGQSKFCEEKMQQIIDIWSVVDAEISAEGSSLTV